MDNNNNNEVNLNSFYTGRNISHKKKKHNKGFKKWWKKRNGFQKTLFSLTCIVLCFALLLGAGWIGLELIDKSERDLSFDDFTSSELGFSEVIDDKVVNIALFGVDARRVGDFSGKSDSIMILSIDKKNNNIKLVSIMRDSLVPYEYNGKKGYTKITEMYAYGGPSLAVKTINQVYGLDIQEYATVNFYGMRDIIDAVGGIEVEITYDEIRSDNAYSINAMITEQCEYLKINPSSYYVRKTGKMHLNGLQAVAYARIRHGVNVWGSNNDFGRTERQRYVMQQLLNKALSRSVAEYPSLVAKITPFVKTSLSNSEIISLAGILAKKPPMLQSRVPSNEYIINADYRGTGASTVYYNYRYAGKVLRAFIYDGITPEDYMAQNGVDKTSWYAAGDAYNAQVSKKPTSSESNDTSSDSSSQTGSSSDPSSNDSSTDTSDNSSTESSSESVSNSQTE